MTNLSVPIKHWSKDDRPREKLIEKGPSVLSNAELLAILLRTGRKNISAVDIARDIMALTPNKDDLNFLGKIRLGDLMKISGVGMAKAVTLAAALELGRRRQSVKPFKVKSITHYSEAVDYLWPLLKDKPQEIFVVLYLNQQNVVTHVEWLSKGGIASTVVDVRIVLRVALEQSATGMILCHNHPAGSTSPSLADIRTTQKIREAAAHMDIRLLDHLIVSEQGYYSFAGEGMLTDA
jgi:DNA repair protein RadC